MRRNVFITIISVLIITCLLVYARTTTTDLNLVKPTWDENVDILADINANSDILEAFANDVLEFDLSPVLRADLDISTFNIEGVDATEFGYLDGVTSDIQTQLSAKIEATLTEEEVEDYVGGMLGGTETNISVVYQDTTNDIDFVVTLRTEEEIEDFVGGMLGGTETNISVDYQDATNDIDFVVTLRTEEEIEDYAGGMFTGNTETGITLTYQDADGTIDAVIGANDIVESMLKFVDSPADEDIFTYESTTGDFEWHTKAELGIGTATSITDGLILEADLNTDEDPVDNDILTFDTTGDNFSWQTPAELGLVQNPMVSELSAGAHTIGFTLQTLTGDGTDNIDWRLGNKMKLTLPASAETLTFTAPSNPCHLTLHIVQDGVGGRDVTFPAAVKWLGTEPTWSDGGASKNIVMSMWYDGTNYWSQGTPWET